MKKLLLIALLTMLSLPAHAAEQKESTYDRVMRTGTIRCGYLPWTDFVNIDANSGEFSGITYDYMTALGKNLGLTIEWTEEIGRGDYIAALEAGRFDAYCTVVAWNAERARKADFIRPIAYEIFNAYVRPDDTRFDHNLAAVNQPDVRIVSIEGDIFTKIARLEFPAAQLIELPQLSSDTDPFLYVETNKADIVFVGAGVGARYQKRNPGKVAIIKLEEPFRFSPASISIKGGEPRFQRMLEIATTEMLTNGTIDKILNKYDPDKKILLRTSKPYEALK